MPHLSSRGDRIVSSGGNTPSIRVNPFVPLNTRAYNHITNLDVQIRIPHTTLVATGWTLGGGDGERITCGWFTEGGRPIIAGRGTRYEIYGNPMYGSGYGNYTKLEDGNYLYEPVYTIGVYNTVPWAIFYERNLPHGFPPIPWGAYLGAMGLSGARFSDVPGTIPDPLLPSNSVYPTDQHWWRLHHYWLKQFSASKGNQSYIILAEPATSDFLQLVLSQPVDQGGCGIELATPYLTQIWQPAGYNRTESERDPGIHAPFAAAYASPTDEIFIENSQIYQWNVLQYYRGSSVALISKEYDNKQSHHIIPIFTPKNITYWGSSKMNTTGVDMDFLHCLNTTIATAVPIINPRPSWKVVNELSPRAGILLRSVGFLVFLVWLICVAYRSYTRTRESEPITVAESKTIKSDMSDQTPVKEHDVKR